MKYWKIIVDHDYDDDTGFHRPYCVYYNRGFIFNNWAFCKSFKTFDGAEKFVTTLKKGDVDEYGRRVIYYDRN